MARSSKSRRIERDAVKRMEREREQSKRKEGSAGAPLTPPTKHG